MLGAIYIDGGMGNAKQFIANHLLINAKNTDMISQNFKGLLIEKCHILGYKEPTFKITKKKTNFEAELVINKNAETVIIILKILLSINRIFLISILQK